MDNIKKKHSKATNFVIKNTLHSICTNSNSVPISILKVKTHINLELILLLPELTLQECPCLDVKYLEKEIHLKI